MAGREISLRRFRWLVRLCTLASLLLVVGGLYALTRFHWWAALLLIAAGATLLWPMQHYRIRPEPGSEYLLVFLTRKECSLCDEARLLLPALTEGTPFTVTETDVDGDRFLRRHFAKLVPILLWQGETLATLRFDIEGLRQRLTEIRQRQPSTAMPP